MSLGPLYVFLGEVSIQALCPFLKIESFVFLEWSHVSSLCILAIKPLSKISLANIFSHTVGFLFILLMFSLAVQKLFMLMKSHLFVLFFISPALGVHLLYKRSKLLLSTSSVGEVAAAHGRQLIPL